MTRLTEPPVTIVRASSLDERSEQQIASESTPSEAVRNFRVALVNMPFAPALRPSIQIGLLKAIAQRAGFPVEDHYFNVALAAELGWRAYTNMEETGDIMFAVAAFREDSISADKVFATSDVQFTDDEAATFDELRERTLPAYIEKCVSHIEIGAYNAVGFTSSFIQNVPCLALARRIKEKCPDVAIIIGGSNVEAEMGAEYVRAFRFIDYVVSGEGDDVFPELLTRLAEGRGVLDLAGVISRHGDEVHYPGDAEPCRDLESLPTPDYDSFYETARHYEIDRDPTIPKDSVEFASIPVQGARGCWWGEKSNCTFCGLLGETMNYRSKSPERFLAELEELSKRYDRTEFVATDPILNMKYLDGVFGRLAARQVGYAFNFYYIKSNLTKEQLKLLARGGMRAVSPGIESLNSHVLKLMRKGVSKLQNVNLLRWTSYYGMSTGYFLLHGFPGERAEDYADERETMRLIRHLQPPGSINRIVLSRFSPNFNDTVRFPVELRRPMNVYNVIYPHYVNLNKTSFFLDCGAIDDVLPEEEHVEARAMLREWNAAWYSDPKPSLTYRRSDSDILIVDTRFSRDRPRTYLLDGPRADIYEAFSYSPSTPAQACAAISPECVGFELDEEFVRSACDDLCDAGLMLADGMKYLSLALPAEQGL